jgi:hypothetical protein
MGATAEWKRAADRERRRLRAVDPEVADRLDELDMERARQQALAWRKRLGMPAPKPPPPTGAEAIVGLLLWITFIGLSIVFIRAGAWPAVIIMLLVFPLFPRGRGGQP